MRLVDYLDKGASLGPQRPCLTTDGVSLTYRDVQDLSNRIAAALVAVGVRQKKQRAVHQDADYGAVVLHFALFGLYVVALPWIGFRITTFAYVAAANAFMAPPRNARQWGRAAALGMITALATYYIFEHYLHVLLPRGRWTDF